MMTDNVEVLQVRLAEIKSLAAEHDHCSGCPAPWWLRNVLAKWESQDER